MAFLKNCFPIVVFLIMAHSLNSFAQEKLNHYLYGGFEPAVVLFKSGVIENVGLNYHTITEEMVYIQNNAFYALDKIENIDTVFLHRNKFIPHAGHFLEVMKKENVLLFVRHKNKLINAGTTTTFGSSQSNAIDNITNIISTGKVYDLDIAGNFKLIPDYSYYIKAGNEFQSISNNRDLNRLFPGRERDIRDYIRANKIKLNQGDDLHSLLIFLKSQ